MLLMVAAAAAVVVVIDEPGNTSPANLIFVNLVSIAMLS